jgi:hypothetical protein
MALGDTCAVQFDFSKRIAPPMALMLATITLILAFVILGLVSVYGLVWPKTFDAVEVMISVRFLYCSINEASSVILKFSIDLASISLSTFSRNVSYLCFSVFSGNLILGGLEGFLLKLVVRLLRLSCEVSGIEWVILAIIPR